MDNKCLLNILNRFPKVKATVMQLAENLDSAIGNQMSADEIEQSVIDTVRHLGQASLQDWADLERAQVPLEETQ